MSSEAGAGHRAPGVSVRIAGGLGNQMFQYAAARALALHLGAPLTLDLSFFDRGRHRRYGLDGFALAPHEARGQPTGARSSRWMSALSRIGQRLAGPPTTQWREQSLAFDERFFQLQAPVHLIGHFQTQRYFESAADEIQRELRPPEPTDDFSRETARQMAEGPSVSLHVRRGDYLSNPKNRDIFACCDVPYYEAALARIPEPCAVFVFSDDMEWSRSHLRCDRHRFVFVDDGKPRAVMADLWLMHRARHHVIANSSLSWWGAWLAKRGDGQDPHRGLTIAPKNWFVHPDHDDRDLVPEGWLRL